MPELKKLIKEKSTLKEFAITSMLKAYDYSEMLFVTPYGIFFGKPFNDHADNMPSRILLADVTVISGSRIIDFKGGTMHLFVDQIIAAQPADETSRSSFLQSLQE